MLPKGAMEIGFGMLFVIYLSIYFLGSSKNRRLAQQFHDQCSGTFSENFSTVGDAVRLPCLHTTVLCGPMNSLYRRYFPKSTCAYFNAIRTCVFVPQDHQALIKESAYEYVLYGTGRQNCKGLTAKLTLPNRHDVRA